jgi:hypothetical protein
MGEIKQEWRRRATLVGDFRLDFLPGNRASFPPKGGNPRNAHQHAAGKKGRGHGVDAVATDVVGKERNAGEEEEQNKKGFHLRSID